MGERGVSCTRRGILSLSSSAYDPFGLTAPYVLIPKCILQELCKNGASWDEEISGKLLDRWNEWISQLYLLDSLKMDRCYKVKWLKAVSSCELHHFADASETGYGMVTYMRLIDEDGNIQCSFVIGKARVAPLKRITIPRMELTAATALVRMNAMLVRELDYTVGNSYYWTDSMSVLRYIANQTSRFHTFVANRLSVIHESSKIEQWRYINTQLNPADYASRGMSMKKLLETPQWINGPDFLSKTVDKWPCNADFLSADLNGDPEVKRVNVAVCEADTSTAMDRLIDHFSDWTKLRKAAAWLMLAVTTFQEYVKKRHCENTKQEEIKTEVRTRGRKRKKMDRTSQAEQQYPSLSVKGVNDAEMALIRYVQKKHLHLKLKV
ncbi:uncharacterized protein LOC125378709 [Haliotis rufescens]|uniref:uncharacterized protein LOC125378709 n=1 Tax=Haliotis rufescens TaxID=6454 RepID=UPI00201F6943|nr:uncharacterized protein LOC125378709 [Haliotis rufescens]